MNHWKSNVIFNDLHLLFRLYIKFTHSRVTKFWSTGEKTYPCKYCDKRFTLLRHPQANIIANFCQGIKEKRYTNAPYAKSEMSRILSSCNIDMVLLPKNRDLI